MEIYVKFLLFPFSGF